VNKNSFIYSIKVFWVCILFTTCVLLLSYFFSHFNPLHGVHVNASTSASADVVIDAGHGGRDGGAISDSGILEKDLNLELSLTLRDFLAFFGVDCILTRSEDSLVCDESDPSLKGKLKMTDLRNRLAIAEENQDSFFISIHMNKFPIEKYKGLQVYFSKNNEKSELLAKTLQESIRASLQPDNNRKSKAAGSNIYLLDRISTPAVLIECGFLSNAEDTTLLSTEEYRAKIALLISESIFKTKENNLY